MIRLQETELSSLADHAAWQASWNDEEKLLAHIPPGYWIDLVEISRSKRLLQREMPVDLRLRFLEFLDQAVHGALTEEAMQRVDPACDRVMEMLGEMMPLNRQDRWNLMMRWNVMASFCNLNPSMIDAMRLFR